MRRGGSIIVAPAGRLTLVVSSSFQAARETLVGGAHSDRSTFSLLSDGEVRFSSRATARGTLVYAPNAPIRLPRDFEGAVVGATVSLPPRATFVGIPSALAHWLGDTRVELDAPASGVIARTVETTDRVDIRGRINGINTGQNSGPAQLWIRDVLLDEAPIELDGSFTLGFDVDKSLPDLLDRDERIRIILEGALVEDRELVPLIDFAGRELVVRFTDDLPVSDRVPFLELSGLLIVRPSITDPGVEWVVLLPVEPDAAAEVVAELRGTEFIAAAAINSVLQPANRDVMPDDMEGDAPARMGLEVAIDEMSLSRPHATVAVLDSGIDFDSLELLYARAINIGELPPAFRFVRARPNIHLRDPYDVSDPGAVGPDLFYRMRADTDGDGVITFGDLNDESFDRELATLFGLSDLCPSADVACCDEVREAGGGDGIEGVIDPVDLLCARGAFGPLRDGRDDDNNGCADDLVGCAVDAAILGEDASIPGDILLDVAPDSRLAAHGTALASVVAATRNGVGVEGVAGGRTFPTDLLGSLVFPVRTQGSRANATLYDTLEGSRIATRQGADINLVAMVSDPEPGPSAPEVGAWAVLFDTVRGPRDARPLFVFAAGHSGVNLCDDDVVLPAQLGRGDGVTEVGVLTVSATDLNYNLEPLTAVGDNRCGHRGAAAPGSGVRASVGAGDLAGFLAGTSASTAVVASMAAFMGSRSDALLREGRLLAQRLQLFDLRAFPPPEPAAPVFWIATAAQHPPDILSVDLGRSLAPRVGIEPAESPEFDNDMDGIADHLEHEIALAFSPQATFGADLPSLPSNVVVLWQVSDRYDEDDDVPPLPNLQPITSCPEGTRALRVTYQLLYPRHEGAPVDPPLGGWPGDGDRWTQAHAGDIVRFGLDLCEDDGVVFALAAYGDNPSNVQSVQEISGIGPQVACRDSSRPSCGDQASVLAAAANFRGFRMLDMQVTRDRTGTHPHIFVSEGNHAHHFSESTCLNQTPTLETMERRCRRCRRCPPGIPGCGAVCPTPLRAWCVVADSEGGPSDYAENCGGGADQTLFLRTRPEANVGELVPDEAQLVQEIDFAIYPGFVPYGENVWSRACVCGDQSECIDDAPQLQFDSDGIVLPAACNQSPPGLAPSFFASFLHDSP